MLKILLTVSRKYGPSTDIRYESAKPYLTQGMETEKRAMIWQKIKKKKFKEMADTEVQIKQ